MIVSAPAKINLTLEITGVESNGYHLLDTIFAWLDLEDSLELAIATQTSIDLQSFDLDASAITLDENNLVLKALRALEARLERELPTHFHLTKRIPAGGGLGGGSADAAAALIGLNELHQLDLSPETLLEIARPLGADVSFGLVGGMARGTRYGDQLRSLPSCPDLLERELVLVFPSFPCPTPEVYRLWDQNPSHLAAGATEQFLQAPEDGTRLTFLRNDLEEPAFRLHPELRELKQEMVSAGLQGVCLSGSGSTLFGFLRPGENIDSLKEGLAPKSVKVMKSKLKDGTRFGLVS